MSLGCISDVSVPEGLKFYVFSLECLFGLWRHRLQMVSWRFVRCDPHSCQRGVQSHVQEFQVPASLLNSALILFFSLHSSEGPESALRPAGAVSRTLLATVRYVAVARVQVSSFPGPASLTRLLSPAGLWSDPWWRSPTGSGS